MNAILGILVPRHKFYDFFLWAILIVMVSEEVKEDCTDVAVASCMVYVFISNACDLSHNAWIVSLIIQSF